VSESSRQKLEILRAEQAAQCKPFGINELSSIAQGWGNPPPERAPLHPTAYAQEMEQTPQEGRTWICDIIAQYLEPFTPQNNVSLTTTFGNNANTIADLVENKPNYGGPTLS